MLSGALLNSVFNTDWWALPETPIKKGAVLFVDKDEGAQVWDSYGQIIFDTGMIEKPKTS